MNWLSREYGRDEPAPSPVALNIESYLQYVVDTNRTIDPRGIMQTTTQASLPLDEVYVSLSAERVRERTSAVDAFERAGIEGEVPRGPLEATVIERVELAEAVRRHARLVLLGDPGAGKTTLMRFLAYHFAKATQTGAETVVDREGAEYGRVRLPILVRIAQYAECLAKDTTLCLRDFLPHGFRDLAACAADLPAAFDAALREGKAVVLLDGLDEVTEASSRNVIRLRIEEFARANPACPLVVTSRIAGYRGAPLGGGFQEFTLRDLDRPQIGRFLARWCPAYEAWRNPNGSEKERARDARREIEAVSRSIDGNPGVRRLAVNPLLLTVLCLIHRNGASLPNRRVELYELATQTLLRDVSVSDGLHRGREVQPDVALRILGPLAKWIHEERPTGLASAAEVRARLAGLLAVDRGKSPEDPAVRDAVEDFLRRVREGAGVFVERAPGQFGFLHLTFQEYFVARELVRRSSTLATEMHRHRHQSRWEEPIRLAVAYVSGDRPEEAADLVRAAILGEGEEFAPSPLEDVLHRDFLLALRCWGDCAGLPAATARLAAERFGRLYWERPWYVRSIIDGTLRKLGSGALTIEIAGNCFERLRYGNGSVRSAAVEVLGSLNRLDSEVRDALLQQLRDENGDVRSSSARALGSLGLVDSEVRDALLERLRDEDWMVGSAAAAALGSLGRADPEVRDALLERLRDENGNVRSVAATALGRLGLVDDGVRDALLERLRDQNWSVRSAAAQALGRLGLADLALRDSLLEKLRDENESVRSAAAQALGSLGLVDPEVRDALLEKLHERNRSVRSAAAGALGALRAQGLADSAVRDALVELLLDPVTGFEAWHSLWKLAQIEADAPPPLASSTAS